MAKLDKKIIGLVTDFGAKGHHYVASMKGVILKINPKVKIIDISHNIAPFSIIETSYIVKTTHKYYPEDTVFIVVVDPGVGSSRKIVAIKTVNNQFFVGPDNGIFSNVFSPDDIVECVTVENQNYFFKPISKIFHCTNQVQQNVFKIGEFQNAGKNQPVWETEFPLTCILLQFP